MLRGLVLQEGGLLRHVACKEIPAQPVDATSPPSLLIEAVMIVIQLAVVRGELEGEQPGAAFKQESCKID